MRIVIVLAVLATEACGGKILMEDADVTTAPAPGRPAPAPKLVTRACDPPEPSTPDFGRIDVTRLGCECLVHDDCSPGEMCVEFPSIDHPRCVATDDACSLITCRDNAACVVTRAVPALPVCYR